MIHRKRGLPEHVMRPMHGGPPARAGKVSVPLIVGIVVGVIALMVLVCGGGGFLFFRFGMWAFAEQVRADLEGNPVLVEHIGRIETFEMDFNASSMVDGDDVFVFNVTGTEGSGVVVAECITIDDQEQVVSGSLELPTGEVHDLFPDGPPPSRR